MAGEMASREGEESETGRQPDVPLHHRHHPWRLGRAGPTDRTGWAGLQDAVLPGCNAEPTAGTTRAGAGALPVHWPAAHNGAMSRPVETLARVPLFRSMDKTAIHRLDA